MKTVIGRTLAITELLAEPRGTTPAAIAAATGLPVSTIYRYLAVLLEQGFARREGGLYLPGRRLQAIQRGHEGYTEFASLVQEELERLQRDSDLTVFLCVRDGAYAVSIKVIESTQRVKLAMSAGDTLPLYAGAPAKLLLAFADETFRDSYLATVDIRRLASNTIADRGALAAELQQIRARGYARSASEADEMASAIAFPVTGRDGATVMALAISGPVQQFHDAALPRLIAMTRDCAARLSASYARYQDAARPHRSNGAAHADHRA